MSLTAISGGGAASVPENTKPEYTKSIGQQRMMQSAVQSAVQSVDETASSKGLPAPMPHANRAGVAAYLSVMNPVPTTSMHTEA